MHTVVLTQVFRQADAQFIKWLQAIRGGHADAAAALAALAARCAAPLPEKGGVRPTMLFATNDQVGTVNEDELRRLPGAPTRFAALDAVELEPLQVDPPASPPPRRSASGDGCVPHRALRPHPRARA
jgi:hypothetical protein